MYMYNMYIRIVLQTRVDDVKTCPLPAPDDSALPSEPPGPVWTAYADSYFEGEFTEPFSDLEEEPEEAEATSGSSETTSLEDNLSVPEEKQPPTLTNVQPQISINAHSGGGGHWCEGSELLLLKSVDSESPACESSTGSPEHSASTRSSQTKKLVISTKGSVHTGPMVPLRGGS